MDSRLVLGVARDADAGDIRAVLCRVLGAGWNCRLESLASATVPTFGVIWNADDGTGSIPMPTALDPCVIADQCMDAIRAVMEKAGLALEEVLFLSVAPSTGVSMEPWEGIVAARLAEETGLTTIVGFATRDRAAGGTGRSPGKLADWILAADPQFSRLVIHVEGFTHFTVLSAAAGPSRVYTSDAGPGVHMLDAMAAGFSQRRQPIDSRGTLAVQGRQLKPLVRHWASHPFLALELPKWLGPRDFTGEFVYQTVQLACERGWSVADVLCTATHFVAACSADAVRQYLAKDQMLDQVVLVGRGTQSGFLLRLLHEQFAAIGLMHVSLPEIPGESYEAATAAVLGCLALDGIPSNIPAVTDSTGPRIAGQLVPGTVANWHRCVTWMQRTVKPIIMRIA